MDVFKPEKRSRIMSLVKGKDTVPEKTVRSYLFSRGLRYRLHVRKLPGCPDLVFPSRRVVVFVHGCFWHGHSCKRAALPKSNISFWRVKISKNIARDKVTRKSLRRLGWRPIEIWSCQLMPKDLEMLYKMIISTRHKKNRLLGKMSSN